MALSRAAIVDAGLGILDAYGLAELDADRLAFHLALDEFF